MSGSRNGNQRLHQIINAISKDLWTMILDIIAVNLAYYLALMIRFYVNNQFRPTVSYYLTDFARFAPFYTVFCIAVFAAFKLYNGMWRYAGINDMNRIIGASLCTAAIHVIGTLIFIRRMPITYYVIGALLQFIFLVLIRFVYRFLIVEHKKLTNRRLPTINVMMVGAGEIGRRMTHQLEEDSAFRTVCVVDNKRTTSGKTIDGIPVLSGADQIDKAIDQYDVKAIFIADPALPTESRNKIQSICEKKGLDFQDYTGYLSNLNGRIPLTELLATINGHVNITVGDQKKEYNSGSEALHDITDHYDVIAIAADGSQINIELKENKRETGYEKWMKSYMEETGEELSYF